MATAPVLPIAPPTLERPTTFPSTALLVIVTLVSESPLVVQPMSPPT